MLSARAVIEGSDSSDKKNLTFFFLIFDENLAGARLIGSRVYSIWGSQGVKV